MSLYNADNMYIKFLTINTQTCTFMSLQYARTKTTFYPTVYPFNESLLIDLHKMHAEQWTAKKNKILLMI